MGSLIWSVLALGLAYYMYRDGKRLGSRLGYIAGRRRRSLRGRSDRRFLR